MPLELLQADITTIRADAIVSASNNHLLCDGSGVSGAIFRHADSARLQAACNRIGYCATGDAVVTPPFGLPCAYIIHTAGPIWQGGAHGEQALLRSCYLRSLDLAREYHLHSIAFPLISSGTYGFPREQALETAASAISGWLSDNDYEMHVFLTLYRDNADARYLNLLTYVEKQYMSEDEDFFGNEAPPLPFRSTDSDASVRLSSQEHARPAVPVESEAAPRLCCSVSEDSDFSNALFRLDDDEFYLDDADFCFEDDVDAALSQSVEASHPPPNVFALDDGCGDECCCESFEYSLAPSLNADTSFSLSEAEPDAEPVQKAPVSSAPPLSPRRSVSAAPAQEEALSEAMSSDEQALFIIRRLRSLIHSTRETFRDMLLRLIDERGMTDPEVYKRANLDRRLFSKIRSNPDYQPAKTTVLALSIALRLNLDQTTDLLRLAGFALSPSSKLDLIVEYFICREVYDIHKINEMLFEFDLKLLGAQ